MAAGIRGRIPSKALFEDGTYSLEEFHDVFIDLEDPTEYLPAIKLVGSWLEWQRIKRDWPAFNTYICTWQEELEVKLKSRAVQQVNTLAEEGSFQASKWIAEHGFNKRQGAGRPSKAETKRAANEIAKGAAETKEEKERVLKLVNGEAR